MQTANNILQATTIVQTSIIGEFDGKSDAADRDWAHLLASKQSIVSWTKVSGNSLCFAVSMSCGEI